MAADEKKTTLRAALEGKSTKELEELLALDFAEGKDEPDVEYIMAILEVIGEREATPEREAETETAWQEFQEYIEELEKEETNHEVDSDADINEEPILDQFCTTGYGQRKSRRPRKMLRTILVAAIVLVLACGTLSVAAGWNPFQALVRWTSDTVRFLNGEQGDPAPNDVFSFMRIAVEKLTDTPAVPNWAPKGTEAAGQMEVIHRKDRVKIREVFSLDEVEFTIQIFVYNSIPDTYENTYQTTPQSEPPYWAGGVAHHIASNNKTVSVMWTNGVVEGYIQGDLSVETIQKMIDSIYEE